MKLPWVGAARYQVGGGYDSLDAQAGNKKRR